MNETSISLIDYQQFYNSAQINFLVSPAWKRKCTDFMKELHQKVAVGDTEKLKTFLRSKRDDVLDTFKQSWLFSIWDRCYDSQINDFDEISFIEKLSIVCNGQIEKDDLYSFFIYKFTTQNIDKLLQQVLQNESQKYSLAINAQNIVIHNGEVIIQWGNHNDNDKNPPEQLKNIIFSDKLFDSDYLLNNLRNTIASFIDLGDDNGKLAPAEENQINPGAQNEWYYILIAISEAEIVARARSKDVSFIDQMISWFSWLFHFDSAEEMIRFKRKFAKSISMERSLWKYGAKKEVTAIKDMWARQRSLGIDSTKVARMQPVARDLKHKLSQLKSDIQQVKQK